MEDFENAACKLILGAGSYAADGIAGGSVWGTEAAWTATTPRQADVLRYGSLSDMYRTGFAASTSASESGEDPEAKVISSLGCSVGGTVNFRVCGAIFVWIYFLA